MKPDIIIPTNKSRSEIAPLLVDVQGYSYGCKVFATCTEGSAAHNRNVGLEWASSDVVIMIDDDTAGFYVEWWKDLIRPLLECGDIIMVSARLMGAEGGGKLGAMMFQGDITKHYSDVPQIPTAVCAFHNDGLRFNESFVGSGFEDTFFSECKKRMYVGSRVVVNNECQIVHKNEMKLQSKYYQRNQVVYERLVQELRAGKYKLPQGLLELEMRRILML